MKREHILLAEGDFAAALQFWFLSAMRPLPWRTTYDAYSVWISEIMLQQTQMDRGVRYFNKWMERLPDIAAVANAGETEILALWEGLGYYSRARNLHRAAKMIMEKHNGVFPEHMDDIRALPGVGEYTAGAIASIAFNLPEPALDANVLRIFSRLCDIDRPTTIPSVRQGIADTVRRLMPADSPRIFCQALMELGALICAKKPRCEECPVARFCRARKNGTAADRPAGKTTKPRTHQTTVCAVILHNGNVAVRQRPTGGLWPNLWEFPGGVVQPGETPGSALPALVLHQTGLSIKAGKHIAAIKHNHTTVNVTLHAYHASLLSPHSTPPTQNSIVWKPLNTLASLPFPAGQRKLLERLGHK